MTPKGEPEAAAPQMNLCNAKIAMERSEIMRRVKSRDTTPERRLRAALRKRGLRFRLCDARLPGKPDIVFPKPRLAVFVDGDYWHGNQWRLRGLARLEDQFKATANRAYWLRKIRRNMERDFTHTAALIEAGWRVLRFWESDLDRDLDACAAKVAAAAAKPARRRKKDTRKLTVFRGRLL